MSWAIRRIVRYYYGRQHECMAIRVFGHYGVGVLPKQIKKTKEK